MSHTSPLGAPNTYWGKSFIVSGVLVSHMHATTYHIHITHTHRYINQYLHALFIRMQHHCMSAVASPDIALVLDCVCN
jgi:hypothetical protein